MAGFWIQRRSFLGKTYEVQLISSQKDALKGFLRSHGYEEFVDAAFDQLDIADSEASEEIAKLLSDEDSLPITLFFSSKEDRDHFLKIVEEFVGDLQTEQRVFDNRIWEQAWESTESNFETERFFVSVNGETRPELEKIHIGMTSMGAFGSGQHATTKAILRLLEKELNPGSSVLDVGTGTGILAIAAEKLGAVKVVATDIEDAAITSASHNKMQNDCEFEIIHGSLPEDCNSFSLIVSNILPPVVNNLVPSFVKLLDGKGKIILAGFNEANCEQILHAAGESGLSLISEDNERGWLAYCFGKENSDEDK